MEKALSQILPVDGTPLQFYANIARLASLGFTAYYYRNRTGVVVSTAFASLMPINNITAGKDGGASLLRQGGTSGFIVFPVAMASAVGMMYAFQDTGSLGHMMWHFVEFAQLTSMGIRRIAGRAASK